MNFKVLDPTKNVQEGFALIKSLELKTTSKGAPYLNILLSDSEGSISAKKWDYKELTDGAYAVNDIVKVRGAVSDYNGVPQLKIELIRETTEDDNVSISDFIEITDISPETMYNTILTLVDTKVTDMDYHSLLTIALADKRDLLLYYPAAQELHHSLKGGLLYHTLSVARICDSFADIYPSIDRSLLLTGAILHDIMKTDEYIANADTGVVVEKSLTGNLLGHLVSGAIYIDRLAKENNIPMEKATLVEHMLVSHHGEPEYGAAIRPLIIEAEILYHADMIDARVNEMLTAVGSIEKDNYTEKLWFLNNRKLLNHSDTDISYKANIL